MDVKDSIEDSSLKCKECKGDRYSKEGICTDRTAKHASCEKYNFLKDECEKCIYSFFLSTDKKSCLAYPVGQIGCEIYKDNSTCLRCEKNWFLKDNSDCTEMPTEDLVENCDYYNSDKTCNVCHDDYFYDGTECVFKVAQNCK